MKAKILFILHLPPPIHGAAMMGEYIKNSHLINSNFHCKYINLTTSKDLGDIGRLNYKKIKHFISLLNTIIKNVRLFKPNIVYVTPNAKGGAFYKDFIVVQILKLLNCRVIVHYHNKGVSKKQDCIFDNILYHIFFKNVKVILLASALYQDIKKYVLKENIYICPNGIPPMISEMSHQHKTKSTTHILFLSNLLIDKGIYVLLDACKILKDKKIPFICNFIGGETTEINSITLQKAISNRNLNEKVIYHGKKVDKEKETFLNDCDIFVLPTLNECFPLVLLEAMRHHTACIASNEGGIPNIIDNEKTGYIIEKNNAQALADKIIFLTKHVDICKQMGIRGYNKYENEYTLDKFESNLSKIFNHYIQQTNVS